MDGSVFRGKLTLAMLCEQLPELADQCPGSFFAKLIAQRYRQGAWIRVELSKRPRHRAQRRRRWFVLCRRIRIAVLGFVTGVGPFTGPAASGLPSGDLLCERNLGKCTRFANRQIAPAGGFLKIGCQFE